MKTILFKKRRQKTDYTCGIASLSIAFSAFGEDYEEKELLRVTKVSEEYGSEEKDMVKAARLLGFKVCSKKNSNMKEIKEAPNYEKPVIVLYLAWGDAHYSVIVGMTRTHLLLADPYKKGCVRQIRKDIFLKRWKPEKLPHVQKWMMTVSKE